MDNFIKDLYNNRKLIWSLAINDFKTKYSGSALGITWAFIQPIVTVLIYWFVFEVGLRSSSPLENVPYVLWLTAGLIPWFLFADAISNASSSLLEYSYLVKKVLFKISVLPLVKLISAIFVHIIFILFVVIVYIWQGQPLDIHILQIPYYTICICVLALGLSYLTSAIILFFRDLGQIIGILLQIGIWVTPIMWSDNMVTEKLRRILHLNPMYYVVQGYRDSFIDKVWFWERLSEATYFWIVSVVIFGIGVVVFKRLKPHFSDVL